MHARNLRNAAIKFEEDIKAPFLQLYSFSSGGSPGKNDKLKILKEVTRHFPGLSAEFDRSTNNQMIKQVHDETIVEIVITGGSLELGSSQGETAECALIAWYGSAGFVDEPLIVEFSFRYGSKKARYARETAQNAFDVFELIQKNMTSWLGQKGATKTGLVFASVS